MKKADIITLVIAALLAAAAVVIVLPATKGDANPLRQREASAALSLEEEKAETLSDSLETFTRLDSLSFANLSAL